METYEVWFVNGPLILIRAESELAARKIAKQVYQEHQGCVGRICRVDILLDS